MEAICSECAEKAHYKCPKCLAKYCSVPCYRLHTSKCKVIEIAPQKEEETRPGDLVEGNEQYRIRDNGDSQSNFGKGTNIIATPENISMALLYPTPGLRNLLQDPLMRVILAQISKGEEGIVDELMITSSLFREFAHMILD